MATVYVFDGDANFKASFFQYFDFLSKKSPLKIHAKGTIDAIALIRSTIELHQDIRALVIYGLDEMSEDIAISFDKLLSEKRRLLVIFVAERHLCPAGFDAFKAILHPPMNPRYLTGEE